MKDCVSPDGHSWKRADRTIEKNGTKSTLMACKNEGCDEVGFLIEEVAQNSGHLEESK